MKQSAKGAGLLRINPRNDERKLAMSEYFLFFPAMAIYQMIIYKTGSL